MAMKRLTQHRVYALKRRRKTCGVRDSEIRGFGDRVLPSGRKRYFLRSQTECIRVGHVIGDTEDITLECVRARARALPTARWEPASETSGPIVFEMVAEVVFRR